MNMTNRETHSCDQCKKHLSSKGNLARHRQVYHGAHKFQCHQCEYHGDDKNFLKDHREKNHPQMEKTYPCDLCSHISKVKYNLLKHKQIKHEDNKFNCDKCEYIGSTERNISKHQAVIYEGE